MSTATFEVWLELGSEEEAEKILVKDIEYISRNHSWRIIIQNVAREYAEIISNPPEKDFYVHVRTPGGALYRVNIEVEITVDYCPNIPHLIKEQQ
jgi:hypothetical protein